VILSILYNYVLEKGSFTITYIKKDFLEDVKRESIEDTGGYRIWGSISII